MTDCIQTCSIHASYSPSLSHRLTHRGLDSFPNLLIYSSPRSLINSSLFGTLFPSNIIGKDQPVFDASLEDCRQACKFFIAKFRDYCIMVDYINPAKDVDSDNYWIQTKQLKVTAALRQAFPQAEWDVLTTTIDSQIVDEDKQHPAKWLAKLSSQYLGEEPIIQCTHNFLRILRQDPGMSIQQWHTIVQLEYHKCNFPSEVNDRLQRDISHASPTCLWCGQTPHAARGDCPAANDTCHRCGKRGHWQHVC